MSRVKKTVALTLTTGVLIDLRAVGDTTSPFNEVGFLEVEFFSNTDAMPILAVTPIVVAQGGTAPAAANYPSFPSNGSTNDTICLLALTDSTTGTLVKGTAKFGIEFAKGYEKDVYGAPVATHVNLALKSSGDVHVTISGH